MCLPHIGESQLVLRLVSENYALRDSYFQFSEGLSQKERGTRYVVDNFNCL